jgi:hypothetical protein
LSELEKLWQSQNYFGGEIRDKIIMGKKEIVVFEDGTLKIIKNKHAVKIYSTIEKIAK